MDKNLEAIKGKDGVFAIMETSRGDIVLQLQYKETPLTVINFVGLSEGTLDATKGKPFYDGLTFHRIIPGFMIQGGDPDGNGTGGPGYSIKGEFNSNGVKNDLHHARGVISMARAMDPDSAGSQFFIMHADADNLDGQYAAFGKVIDGMDEVDRIASVPTGWQDAPVTKVVMKKVTVEEA